MVVSEGGDEFVVLFEEGEEVLQLTGTQQGARARVLVAVVEDIPVG